MSSVWTTPVAPRRIDWHAMKDRIDLPSVAVALMGPPQGRRGDRGHRLWWRCPFHDDNNPSLSVDRERRDWRCWGCGEHGDAAALVMKRRSLTFPEAVRWLADFSPLSGVDATAAPLPTARAPTRPPDEPTGLPSVDALALVGAAAERLWTPQGSEALSYLHGRGLTDETIRSARLGYISGASIPTRDGDRTYRVSGVVVPWYADGRLAKVNVRRLREGDQKSKYMSAFEDRPSLYSLATIRPGSPLVAVEGEFEAMLLHQEIGEYACVLTVGSSSARVDAEIRRAARSCLAVFAAHDADDAGDKAAAKWPARAIRVRPPEGCKDWTDVHASGFNRLRYVWGRYLPLGNPPKDEDFAPPVAGLSDDEPDDYATAEREAIQGEGLNLTQEETEW